MLKLIEGGNHSDREVIFINSIKKSAESGKDVLVIIPDQFSFEYDKKLYDALGGKLFNKIRTAGFNRLAQRISKEFGLDSKDKADDNAVIITMYKAVKRFKYSGEVRFFQRSLSKSTFIADLINLIDELISSGIGYKELRIASERVEGRLSSKLFDLSKIYEYFLEELEKTGLKNNLNALNECYEIVKEHNFFNNKCVYIDSFTDFSIDEYKLIECMIKQAEDVTFSLVIAYDETGKTNLNTFAETIRAASMLKNIADKYNVRFDEMKIRNTIDSKVNPDIAHIEENLYSPRFQMIKSENVQILSATDLYEEIEFICAEIFQLVKDEQYRYKDIAVLAGNVDEISPIVEGVFERYDIPYYIDSKQGVSQSILVIYLKSIFECVLTKKWNTEKILKYIKSPLSVFFDYDICDLENYCICWNVNGDMWSKDFTALAPEYNLKRINETRQKIIDPLQNFKYSCENASAKEICVAFYNLLDEIRLSQQLFSKIKIASSLKSDNELELAREFKQVWQTSLSAVSAIYKNTDDEKMSLREFYDIFTLMVSQMTVSRPPQKLDSVRIASTDHSRLSNVKVAFVVEVNEGIFPAGITNKGLLSLRDKKELEKLELSVADNPIHQIESERLDIYTALTLPNDKLYITYSESDSVGGKKSPSIVISMLNKIFVNINDKIQNKPVEFFCTSYRTAMYKYLEKKKDKDVKIEAVRESLKSSPKYEQKLKNLLELSSPNEYILSDSIAKELFFYNDLNMSATRINEYNKCPFMYFCKYGLKLKKTNPVQMNPLNVGNLIHSCFERIMSKEDENGRRIYNNKFVNLTDDVIKDTIHIEFQRYIDENLGGDFGKNATFEQSQKRLEESAFFAVKNIQSEFEQCLFVPAAFEYNLTKDDNESILRIDVDEDIRINIRGSIDRVDIATDENGQRYVRIVDYKTGITSLKLEELYNGLNLQMLIYLLAVTERINDLNFDGKLNPSAILYSHINFVVTSYYPENIRQLKENDEFDNDLVVTRASAYKPDGLIIENEFTISALNNNFKYAFTPLKTKKNGEIATSQPSIVTENYFLGLEQFALRKIYEMANKLKCGKISADPMKKGHSLTCTYCDYWGICGNSSPKNPRTINKKEDIHKLNAEIQEIMDDMAQKNRDI